MSPLHVQFQFLRLAKLLAAKSTERPRAPWIGRAAVGAVHVEVVEAKEELNARELRNQFNPLSKILCSTCFVQR